VTFRKADAYALPQFSSRFTAGLAAFWWSHIPRPEIRNFLAGFHRALTPGAKVVFIDNSYVEGSSTPISRVDEHGNTYQLRLLQRKGITHEVRKNFPTADELRQSVEGMVSAVQVEFLRYYWILSYVT
jgi:demethylmenaquinone methyltransferase/2-methoxy-6-polyprenyl-1,4-benzoquinol methylase